MSETSTASAPGDADVALIENDITDFARNGTALETLDGDPIESLRGVATLYLETNHTIICPDANIDGAAPPSAIRYWRLVVTIPFG